MFFFFSWHSVLKCISEWVLLRICTCNAQKKLKKRQKIHLWVETAALWTFTVTLWHSGKYRIPHLPLLSQTKQKKKIPNPCPFLLFSLPSERTSATFNWRFSWRSREDPYAGPFSKLVPLSHRSHGKKGQGWNALIKTPPTIRSRSLVWAQAF